MALVAVHSKVVVLLRLINCLLFPPFFCGSSVFGPYFVVRSLVSFLVVQSSLGERES